MEKWNRTFFSLIGGEVIGSQLSTCWVQPVWGLRACRQHTVKVFHLVGFQYQQNGSKIVLWPLWGGPGPAARLFYCFLPSLPLSLHPLPSLIHSYKTSSFELREGPGSWMKPISCNQEMQDTERLVPRNLPPPMVLLGISQNWGPPSFSVGLLISSVLECFLKHSDTDFRFYSLSQG